MSAQQLFISSYKGYFNLRSPKAGGKPSAIFFVARINKVQLKFSTGVKVYPEQWNKQRQECYISHRLTELDNRNNTIANEKLAQIITRFSEFKEYICANPVNFNESAQLVKEYIYKDNPMKKDKSTENPIVWLKKFITTDKTIKRDPSSRTDTERMYLSHLNVFEQFLKDTGRLPITFGDMNSELINCYEAYLFDKVVNSVTGDTMSTSTVANYCKTIVAIIKRAERFGKIDIATSKIDRYKAPKSKVESDKAYLTESEIQAIYDLPLTKTKEIEVRDCFVLQCYTGQRYSDIKELKDGVVNIDMQGRTTITIVQKKTSTKVVIPVLPIAKTILEKYDYNIPIYSEFIVTNTIRKLARGAGILRQHIDPKDRGSKISKEPISVCDLIGTHTARRSYATNMINRGYDREMIKKITGHKTDSAFQKYVKISSEDAANFILSKESVPLAPTMPDNEKLSMLRGCMLAILGADFTNPVDDFISKITPTIDRIDPTRINAIVQIVSPVIRLGQSVSWENLLSRHNLLLPEPMKISITDKTGDKDKYLDR